MANKICYIVGSGVFDGRNFAPRTADFIIAADGGYRYLERMDIMPDLIMAISIPSAKYRITPMS